MNKILIKPENILTLAELLVSLENCAIRFALNIHEQSYVICKMLINELSAGEILIDKKSINQCYYHNSEGNYIFSLEHGIEPVSKLGDFKNFINCSELMSMQQIELFNRLKYTDFTDYHNTVTDYSSLHTITKSAQSDLVVNKCVDIIDSLKPLSERMLKLNHKNSIINSLFCNNKPCSPEVFYNNRSVIKNYTLYDHLLWTNKNHHHGIEFLLSERGSESLITDLIEFSLDVELSRPLPTYDNNLDKKTLVTDSVVKMLVDRDIDLLKLIEDCSGIIHDSTLSGFQCSSVVEQYLSHRIGRTLSDSINDLQYTNLNEMSEKHDLNILTL